MELKYIMVIMDEITMTKNIEKILSCTVNENRETETGITYRLTFGKNEIPDDGVKTILKFEFMDAIPTKWKELLDGIGINDTMKVTIEVGARQARLE